MTTETRERFRELLQDRDAWDFSTPGVARHPEGATIRPDYKTGKPWGVLHIACNGEGNGKRGEPAIVSPYVQELLHHFARSSSIEEQETFYRGIPAGCPRPKKQQQRERT